MTAPPTQAERGRDGRSLLKAKDVAALLSCSVGNIRNNPIWRTLMLDFGQRMKRWDHADVEEMIAHIRQHSWKSAGGAAEAIRARR